MEQSINDEVILLTIIYNHNELLEELQLKEKVLSPNALDILNAMKKTFAQNKVIDGGTLITMVKANCLNMLSDIIANEVYVDLHYKEQFISVQKRILDNYKINAIDKLSKQLSNKQITIDVYNKQIEIMNEYKIVNSVKYLDIDELKNNIYISNKGIKFNHYDKLQNKLRLVQNDLLIIGASTGVGKSGFLLNLMNDLMDNYQCIYFNIEMAKSTIYRRLIAIHGNLPVDSIDNPTEYQNQLINQSIQDIENRKVIIENQINDVQEIKSIVSKAKDKDKHTIVFIDHVGLLKSNNGKSLYEQTTAIAKELRKICLQYDCTMIVASQLNRTSYNADVTPSLNMLKDSGELENSARKVILLYRDRKSPKESLEPIMNVDIQKNDNGGYGIIPMKYYKKKQTFVEETVWQDTE